MNQIEKAVRFMVDTALDDTHGYDQQHRNGPDYDCSSLVGTALHEAGFDVSPFSWTGNLEPQLRKCGFVDCKKPWRAGDIHLTPGKHVAMSINSQAIVHASINELGKVTGGKTGDQTGKEICIRDYYEHNGGWALHLRYPGEEKEVSPLKSDETIAREVIAGKWGNGVERVVKLTSAGYVPDYIQSIVNDMLTEWYKKSDGEIAREVIAGKWGNGKQRVIRLNAAGYDYDTVQGLVNQILRDSR